MITVHVYFKRIFNLFPQKPKLSIYDPATPTKNFQSKHIILWKLWQYTISDMTHETSSFSVVLEEMLDRINALGKHYLGKRMRSKDRGISSNSWWHLGLAKRIGSFRFQRNERSIIPLFSRSRVFIKCIKRFSL